ncbi:nitroreductase/quinone reductase family protein [Williamsia sp. MIQD14]|uniref:nitroreductase/quinone reductase family protein n=1 Tax=Williamsia sp. MIQD14 TaxID=3425703 RepID=UPI003DA0788E
MTDFNEMIINEFRSNNGHVETAGFGDNLVVLHSIGAKSGDIRLNPLFALSEDDSWLIVGSAAGAVKHPAWVHNLRANPRIEMEIPDDGKVATITVDVTEVPDSEWDADWKKFTDASPGFGEYTKTAEGRKFPIFRITRA